MTARGAAHAHLRILAARCARSFARNLDPPNRGRRESRVSDAPAAAREGSTRVSHHEFTGSIRLSPRNGFNGLFRALPGDRALLPPSLTDRSANLTPASGCQDHTTSPSAIAPFVKGTISVHCIPHPTSVTTAKRPSCERGMGTDIDGFATSENQNIFARRAGQMIQYHAH
jgi:hypothetical protein